MCGRYELHSHPAAIALAFGLAHTPDVRQRYNIAPRTDVAVVRVNAEGRCELVAMRWGFVPRWAKDPAVGDRMINARGETIAEKPTFRMAYRRHRCLLPADGFYEWMPAPGGAGPGHKVPVHVGMKDGALFAMGGLFERWRSPDGEILDTCAIVTTDANACLRPVHDRMPLIVPRDQYARWLDPTRDDVADLIVPYPPGEVAYYPVSARVNNVHHDDASLILHAPPPAGPETDDAQANPAHPPEQESLF
jgi:putative SOS response-associated peptidase YedK